MELGVMVSIYDETDIPAAFWHATEAGFRRGQVSCFIQGITAAEIRQIALAARACHFQVDAVGCYMNPLRLDDPSLSGVDSLDWRTLAENMAMLGGVERIVCWSGTLGRTLAAPNLLNNEEETFNSLYIALSGMRETVRGLPVQILLEPYTAHVLDDADACVRLTRRFPAGDVKIALDVPNLLTPRGFAAQQVHIPDVIARIAPAVGLVHLKDAALDSAGRRIFLPPGQGVLDFRASLRAIADFLPEVPVVIEQVTTLEEMRSARQFVLAAAKAEGL